MAKQARQGSGQGKEEAWTRMLPAELTSALGRLELLARTKKEGGVTGKHSSPHKGYSVEFAEHRPYVHGDDLRDLDWRALGKSDRFYIKQYSEETNLRAMLLVDASGSMRFAGREAASLDGQRLSKFDYARHLAAALAYLLIRQQDAVGLVTFDTKVRSFYRAMSRPSQVKVILEELHRTEPGEDTAAAAVFHDIAERIPRRGLVVIFSDLFDNADAIHKALHHFRYRNHELIVFHLMAEEELSFPFRKFTTFKNLEGGGALLKVDPLALRAQYLAGLREFLETIARACGQMKGDYVEVNTRIPVADTLSRYLAGRRSIR